MSVKKNDLFKDTLPKKVKIGLENIFQEPIAIIK